MNPLMIACHNRQPELVKRLLDGGADPNIQKDDGYTALMIACQNGYENIVKILLGHRGVNLNLREKIYGSTALIIASLNGYQSIVKALLNVGADPNIQKDYGYTALMMSSLYNKYTVVKTLLDGGADPNIQKDDGYTALMIASLDGHLEVIKTLLGSGRVNLNIQNNIGSTALIIASLKGHVDIVKVLLDGGANPNIHKNDGFTALMMSSINGYQTVVKVLLDGGAEPNIQKDDGYTALMIACQKGHLEVVKTFLGSGRVNLNIQEKIYGSTALIIASLNGYQTVVKALLDGGADPNIHKNDGFTALMVASINGYQTVVKVLLDGGVDPNIQKDDGYTALMIACQNGHLEVVKTFLGSGRVNLNIQEKYGSTALIIATSKGHVDIVKALLDGGADPNIKKNNGGTALIITSSEKGHVDIVKALLDGGADPNIRENGSTTALMNASQRGYLEVVKALLLDGGADPNLQENNGHTALMMASQKGYTEIVKALLNGRADPNIKKGDNGFTALMMASIKQHSEVVKALLDGGADPNIKDEYVYNSTVLMMASRKGYLEVVKALLDGGADPNIKDVDGRTALMYATLGRQSEVAKALLDRGADPNIQDNIGHTAFMLAHLKGYLEIAKIINTEYNNGSATALDIKNILEMSDVYTEDFYIKYLERSEYIDLVIDNPVLYDKITAVETFFKSLIKDSKNIDYSFIPLDADILYYYKLILKFGVVPDDCFLNILKNPETILNFIFFIKTHVKADGQFLNDKQTIRSGDDIYKTFNICVPIDKSYSYCGALAKTLSCELLTISNENCDALAEEFVGDNYGSCIFNKTYVPIPRTQSELTEFKEFIQNPQLQRRGDLSQNGIVFIDDETELVLKIPLKVSNRTLYEAVVSMCVVNKFLSETRIVGGLSYCYGLFSCPEVKLPPTKKQIKAQQNDIVKETLCQNEGPSNIYSIYKKMPGDSLTTLLSNPENIKMLSPLKLYQIIQTILKILIPLQEGKHSFTHNDLHCGNIMIDNFLSDEPVVSIIDYGLSSFTVSGIRYNNWLEDRMGGSYVIEGSGVYDMYFFLESIKHYGLIEESISYISTIMKRLLSGFLDDEGNTIPYKKFSGVNWIYTEGPIATNSLHNTELFNKRSYRWIYEEFFDGVGSQYYIQTPLVIKVKGLLLDGDIRNRYFPGMKQQIIAKIRQAFSTNTKLVSLIGYVDALYDRWAKLATNDFEWTESSISYRVDGLIYTCLSVFGIEIREMRDMMTNVESAREWSLKLIRDMRYVAIIPDSDEIAIINTDDIDF
jgi:ankyrin repeat protein/serine/threonine protein kinase